MPLRDPDCLFCKILDGQIPSAQVYEDERIVAFMNLQQKNPGHTLVIPKDHHRNVYDMPDELLGEVAKVAAKIARAVKQEFKADGVNILQNNEPAAMQSIFHFHSHVIPRYFGDDLLAIWHSPAASPEELASNAAKIKAGLT